MKLYEIDRALEELIDRLVDPETGELAESDEFDKLQMERDRLIEYLIKLYKNHHAEAEAMKAEIKTLAERKRAREKTAEGLKQKIEHATSGIPFKCAAGDINYRSVPFVNISENAFVPEKYMRVKYEPDKNMLSAALKEGEVIPGIEIEHRQSMSIK